MADWRSFETAAARPPQDEGVDGSPAVIGMPGQERGGPIDLLQQHDPHQLMRPGGGAEGQPQVGAVAQHTAEAIRPADHEGRRRTAGVAPAPDPLGEFDTVEALAPLVESDADGAFRNDGGKRNRFLDHALFRLARLAFANFDNFNAAESDAAT